MFVAKTKILRTFWYQKNVGSCDFKHKNLQNILIKTKNVYENSKVCILSKRSRVRALTLWATEVINTALYVIN